MFLNLSHPVKLHPPTIYNIFCTKAFDFQIFTGIKNVIGTGHLHLSYVLNFVSLEYALNIKFLKVNTCVCVTVL